MGDKPLKMEHMECRRVCRRCMEGAQIVAPRQQHSGWVVQVHAQCREDENFRMHACFDRTYCEESTVVDGDGCVGSHPR